MLPGMELLNCPELAVPREVMHHVVHVESSYNPYAIGVVGGHLVRQPKSLAEALSTVQMLESRGFNFSVGLAQVNRYNLGKYGLRSYAHAFDACPNLQAGSRILAECYRRHGDWGKSFSCYYSGNPVTGFRHGYVQKVFASMTRAQKRDATAAAGEGIPVVTSARHKPVPVTRFPLRGRAADEPVPSRASPVLTSAPTGSGDPAQVGATAAAPVVPSSPPGGAANAIAAMPEAGAAQVRPGAVPVRLGSDAVRLQPAVPPPMPTPAAGVGVAPVGDAAFVF